MQRMLERFIRTEFAPPRYLAEPSIGIDVSVSGIKMVRIVEKLHGLELVDYAEERLQPGAINKGEIADRAAVVAALKKIAKVHRVSYAHIALPESRGYLFETGVDGQTPAEWRLGVERTIEEFVPLPPHEVAFDIAPLLTERDRTQVVGAGYARRVVDDTLHIFDDAGVRPASIEGEVFSLPRALMKHGDNSTVLIIDVGRTTTKLTVATRRLPRFTTTLDIGGHALTLAVQKHFGVTEEEAKRVKAERGLVAGDEGGEYLEAMLSTVSAIREEIVRRLDYWQTRAGSVPEHEPVSRALLVGGNATVRGLPEYLESALKVPVELGDVFSNLAPRHDWLPPMDYTESLAYGTAIGLALRNYVP